MKNFLIVILLFSSASLGQQDGGTNNAQEEPSCVTHTVRNETTDVTNTITRCRGKIVSDFFHKHPEPKETGEQEKNYPSWHRDPFNSFSDLDAQVSMAESTHWIKWISIIGAVLSAFGLWMLWRTISQNQKTLEYIQRTSSLELKPYLSASFCDVVVINDWDSGKLTQTFQLIISIKNSGKTPASEVFVSIEKSSSLGWMKGWSGNSADFQSISAMSAQDQYIGDSPSTLRLTGVWRTNRKSEWPADQERGVISSENEWGLVRVTLRDLCVRYKDMECEGESWHKLIRGDIQLQDPKLGDDGRFLISFVDTEEDKGHEHYREKAT